MRRPTMSIVTIVVVVAAVVLASCRSDAVATNRRLAVASFFPIAATLRALDPGVTVVDLTPPGVEPHDLELTTGEMDHLLDARLVAVMGDGFQPAIERAAMERGGNVVFVLDRLHVGSDPHVWLDPLLMRRVVRILAAGSIRAQPDDRPAITARARELDRRLVGLDRAYRTGLTRCARRSIVTAHEAFGRLAHRYHLRQIPIVGISPDQEPDAQRLGDLTDVVRKEHVTTIFTEAQVSPRIARTLAREAGVRTTVLDPIESPAHARSFGDYVRAMQRNLKVLRRVLECSPDG